MDYIIGIDAGGTKTKGLILSKGKEIMFEVETGYGNPNIHYQTAISNISEVLSKCLASPFGPYCHLVVAGIAGIEAGDHRQSIYQNLSQKTPLSIILVNDAVLAYHSIFELGSGVLTIAGTGSVSYGKNGENDGYAGGWGHLLGDEGSSYDIAIKACKKLISEKDTGINYSPLSLAILKELTLHDANDLKGFIYHATKGEIAALSYVVYLQAKHGDKDAQNIFHKAGMDLGNQTIRLIKRLGLTIPFSVAGKGSLLEKNTYVQEAFKQTIKKHSEAINVSVVETLAATGAFAIAKIHGYQ